VLRQLAGAGKIAAAVDWIGECIKDKKLVVFAYHIEVQEALFGALSSNGIPVLSITGDMSIRARRDAIHQFQVDPTSMVIICSLRASQTAITLTAAQNALMSELDWTPSSLEQAEDRLHRIGQLGQVEITYMRAVNTLDDRMISIIDSKRKKISVLGAVNAPYGYRKDGKPRLQPAGPGRPRLTMAERDQRKKSSKAGWQARHPEYMREYMRQVRLKKKIKQAESDVEHHDEMKKLGCLGWGYEIFGSDPRRHGYNEREFGKDLEEARVKAEIAQTFLNYVKEIKRSDSDKSQSDDQS